MPTIAVTIVDQTVAVTQAGEIGPTGATGATGSVSAAGDGSASAPGIAFASDTNTGIFRPGADILAVATGGTERVRIDASGNLGVGTTGPAANLHIYRNSSGATDSLLIEEDGTGDASMSFLLTGETEWSIGLDNSDGNYFKIAASGVLGTSDRLVFDTSTGIGMGTSSPAANLHIYRNTSDASDSLLIEEDGTGDAAMSFLLTGETVWTIGLDNSDGNVFKISSSAALGTADRLIIDNSSNVVPGSDNVQNFGDGSRRWATIYAGTGTINTSDERYKVLREGGDLTEAEYLAWSDVRAIVYQDKDSYDRKGDDARLHVGYSWQTIRAAFAAQGLDANRYGLWCEDPVLAPVVKTRTAQRQATDADGNPLTEAVPVLDDGEPALEQVQAVETVEEAFAEVRMVDGEPVLVRGVRTVERPIFDAVQVKDADTGDLLFRAPDPQSEASENGDPVPMMAAVPRMVSRAKTEMVPVMEDFEEEFTEMAPTGETIGALRYQECAVLEAAWLRRQLALVEARVAALEGL